jgi:GLPGLI family protein
MASINTVEELQALASDASQMPVARDSYFIYKNYENGVLTYIDHIPSDTYKFEESFDVFKWKIHNDTATIKGYKVQKASCDFGGRTWVAWFAPEIPYGDGPYKFTGLPGLILNIHDTQKHYNFEFGSIERPSNAMKMITYKEKNYIETTKYGFFRAQDGFRHDIVNRAKAAGMSSETQQIAARNLLKRNNPIELKRK